MVTGTSKFRHSKRPMNQYGTEIDDETSSKKATTQPDSPIPTPRITHLIRCRSRPRTWKYVISSATKPTANTNEPMMTNSRNANSDGTPKTNGSTTDATPMQMSSTKSAGVIRFIADRQPTTSSRGNR